MSVIHFAPAVVGPHGHGGHGGHDHEEDESESAFIGAASAGQSRGLAEYEIGELGLYTLYVNLPRTAPHELYIIKEHAAILMAAFKRLIAEEPGVFSRSVFEKSVVQPNP